MKKIFYSLIVILLLLLSTLAIIMTSIGIETDRFNNFIVKKVEKNNSSIKVKLKKIKFKLDIKNFDLFLETKKPKLVYKDLNIPIQNIKVYLNFVSLIKSQLKIDKIYVSSSEINIEQFKKIIVKTKPSTLNSLITNKIEKGKLLCNLELYFNDDLDVINFIARGKAYKINSKINDRLSLKNTSFNFFADTTDILVTNIISNTDGLLIKNGNLKINNNEKIDLKFEFDTEVKINKENINNYLTFFRSLKFINKETKLNADLNNYLQMSFDKTFKIINYTYKNTGNVNEMAIKINKSIKNSFLTKDINNIYFKKSDFNFRYSSDKNNSIDISGVYSTNNDNFYNFNIKNNFFKNISKITLNLDIYQKINIDLINYNKNHGKIANVNLNIEKKKNYINIKTLKYLEDKNLISIRNLKVNDKNLISFSSIKVKTYKNKKLKNDFSIHLKKKIKIVGNKFDANNLNKLLNDQSNTNILKKISKDIEIDLKTIDTPLSKKLKNFRLIGNVEKGKFSKISAKGDFGDNKFLDVSMKNDKINKKKYLEVYSDLPQPLLTEYSFFKGLSEGVLTFSSIIDDRSTSSKLIIDNFKVVNAPGLVKLLSLADFGGLADLAEGDGISFEKMEINMTSKKELLKLNDLFAVGPSISVLMDGYKETGGLISLKGTLVPAKNLNKILSKIPLIGKIIIPKEVGEGLFGVSFKIKGQPDKLKTTINPIKTLTPRFITKALEKSKKTK